LFLAKWGEAICGDCEVVLTAIFNIDIMIGGIWKSRFVLSMRSSKNNPWKNIRAQMQRGVRGQLSAARNAELAWVVKYTA